MLLLDDGHCFRTQALALCAKSGARETDFRATSLATLVQMVSAGTGVTLCDQFGPAFAFPDPAADPEGPAWSLNRVDVAYTVTPIIPGTAFNVVLPANLKFHRQVSMRSLF